MDIHKSANYLSLLCIFIAFAVIMLGAYTRLTDAGLGCPDWPGCYGQLIAPSTLEEINAANASYPQTPVDVGKARTEMTHRYFAQTLGTFIMMLSILLIWKRRTFSIPLALPLSLIFVVLFQGLLGMWTVTMGLLPVIVLSHLLGGFCTLTLLFLCWLFLKLPSPSILPYPKPLTFFAAFLLVLLIGQITLGGWTSANYAALICPDFPTCQGQWWPNFDASAFNFLGEVMGFSGRTSIHMLHRLGAVLTFLVGMAVSLSFWKFLPRLSLLIGFLLSLQVLLGISNIVFLLPLPIAVIHNGTAAALLLSVVALNFTLHRTRHEHG